jgi:hypothetical protein
MIAKPPRHFLDRSRRRPYDLTPEAIHKRRKIVTIAAGFKCDDGIVICADSEESTYDFKRNVVKIEIRSGDDVSTAAPVAIFTGSGESVFIDELIDKIWSAIEASWRRTLKEVAMTVEQSNRGYHETIWKLYPRGTARSDLPSADLIIALWAKDGYGLYETRSATFRSVKDFATVGAGESLAHYICDSAHNEDVRKIVGI